MAKLKNRQKQIPNGFRFMEPLSKKWKPPQFASFDVIVQSVIAHRRGNPALSGLSLDYNTVADEVDEFNANLCLRMGWTEYVQISSQPGVSRVDTRLGKVRPPQQNPSGAVAAGAARIAKGALTLLELFGPSQKPVAKEVAENRAGVCASCPENRKGDLLDWFTEGAANKIRTALGIVKDSNLVTSRDGELNVCGVCACPLKLKVWTDLEFVKAKTDSETMQALPEWCWIKGEAK